MQFTWAAFSPVRLLRVLKDRSLRQLPYPRQWQGRKELWAVCSSLVAHLLNVDRSGAQIFTGSLGGLIEDCSPSVDQSGNFVFVFKLVSFYIASSVYILDIVETTHQFFQPRLEFSKCPRRATPKIQPHRQLSLQQLLRPHRQRQMVDLKHGFRLLPVSSCGSTRGVFES